MAVSSSFSNSSLARLSRRSISKAEILGSSNARATYLAPTDPCSTRPAVLAPVPQREVGVPAPSEGSSPAKVLSSVMCRWKSPSPPTRGGSPPLAEALAAFLLSLHPSLRFTVSSKKAHRRLVGRKRRHPLKRTIIFLDRHPFSPRGAPIPLPPPPPPRSERAGVKREQNQEVLCAPSQPWTWVWIPLPEARRLPAGAAGARWRSVGVCLCSSGASCEREARRGARGAGPPPRSSLAGRAHSPAATQPRAPPPALRAPAG